MLAPVGRGTCCVGRPCIYYSIIPNRCRGWSEGVQRKARGTNGQNDSPARASQIPAPTAAANGRCLHGSAARPLDGPHCVGLARPSRRTSTIRTRRLRRAAFSPEDEQFLDDLERSNFLFFWEQASPQTGLIKDRCNARATDTSVVASVASTGFGLTAICIAEKRGFVSHEDARQRVLATLTFLWKTLPTHRGFFYHFANINTGERVWDSEVSSVDTAILLCGILTCRRHFEDRDIVDLAHAIFDRVDWTWLSEDTALLPQGWTPEFGFLPYKWDYYSELMMIYLLGMGSPSHPLHPSAWLAWKRTTFEYDGERYIGSFAPLFVHQYSQAWFDFRRQARQVCRLLRRTRPSRPTYTAASASS